MPSILQAVLLSLAARALAVPAPIVVETCQSIKSALPNKVSFRGEKIYDYEISDYFNGGIVALKPACIVYPTSTDEVSATVKILANSPKEVRFAVKSGGHDPNAGHASVHEGVLISMRNLNGTKYNREKGVAYVKPGGQWRDVIRILRKDRVTVVGGRVGNVGIGGYLTQGGLSYLSAQHGMGCDVCIPGYTFEI
jgi:FAD/FMN-containing dehydrogenase